MFGQNFTQVPCMTFKRDIVELRGVFAISLQLRFTWKNYFDINPGVSVGNRRFHWFCCFAPTYEWAGIRKRIFSSDAAVIISLLKVSSILEGCRDEAYEYEIVKVREEAQWMRKSPVNSQWTAVNLPAMPQTKSSSLVSLCFPNSLSHHKCPAHIILHLQTGTVYVYIFGLTSKNIYIFFFLMFCFKHLDTFSA